MNPPLHPDDRPPREGRLFSPTSEAERARVGKRLLWALPAALGLLLLLVLLGPSAEEIDRKFTPYGADGPLQIMPEISVDDGRDVAQRRAARDDASPPPAPEYEVEPEEISPEAERLVPEVTEQTAPVVADGESREASEDAEATADSDGQSAVDMFMPSQHADSDFIIRKLVRPLYPAGASVTDRQKPLIVVEAAFFLNEQAEIVAVMIQSNGGGNEFATAVTAAMEQWEFAPRLRDGKPPAPRWLVVTWRFRSPFSPVRAD